MWASAEGLAYWSRDQYVDFAANSSLSYNPGSQGGQDLESLAPFLKNSINALNTPGSMAQITTQYAASLNDIPDLGPIITRGTVYAAFTWPGSTGGHVNVIYGVDDSGHTYCADPSDAVKLTIRPLSFWYQSTPSFFAWKTPAQP
jgi:hypothetical protein